MKKFFSFYFLFAIILPITVCSQGIDNNWLLGGYSNNTGFIKINFDSLPVAAHNVQRKMKFRAACATISDSSGSLLFYSNGIFIADASGDTMQNGSGISIGSFGGQFDNFGIPAPQSVIILPSPISTTLYYLFYLTFTDNTATGWWMPHGAFFSLIDMSQNNGLGAVVQKGTPIIMDSLISSEMTACKHGNGRDWWIITHERNSDKYVKFLLTPNGVQGPYNQNIGSVFWYRGRGQSCFSPDGRKFACYHPIEDLDILDFDRCSGLFSNFRHVAINDSAAGGGVAFSPNSNLLYVSSSDYLYQLQTSDTNLVSSMMKVATWDGYYSPSPPFATTFYLSQLAADGRIYINSTNGVESMHYITNPDSLGFACNVCQHCLALPAANNYTMPNHPNYFLGADSGSVCDTLQLGIRKEELRIQKAKISVFPNPARDKIQVSYAPSKKLQFLEIVDVHGKIILKLNIPQWSQLQNFNIEKFVEGVYLCRLVDGGKVMSTKFVVVH